MRKIASAVLVSLVCMGCGWRAQSAVGHWQNRSLAVDTEPAQVNLANLLSLILSHSPTLAFSPSSLPLGKPILARSLPEALLGRSGPVMLNRPHSMVHTDSPSEMSRAQFLQIASAAALSLQIAPAAHAQTPEAAEVTDKVQLDFVVQVDSTKKQAVSITVGLFGKEAPEAVKTFRELSAGTLKAKCKPPPDVSQELFDKDKVKKLTDTQNCLGGESEPVSYGYSTVWAILKGKRINAGQIESRFRSRTPPQMPLTESATLSHDAPGLLSVPRGGGTFDFAITTAATPEYDQDFAVIGRVIEGLQAVKLMETIPVVKAADIFKAPDPTQSGEKSCYFGGTNTYCSQLKPMMKTTLVKASVL